jgi:opacity protein-like surface antigen
MAQAKAIASIRLLALTAAAALLMMSAASSADAPNPFIGKWALDLQKSTFHPGPSGIKSQTVIVTEASGGATHSVIDTVGADGSTFHVEFTSGNDGKPVPTTGDADSDSVVLTSLNPNTAKEVFLKAGKPTATGTLTVSKNGKIFQAPFHGTNADGSKWNNHFVYVRQ